MAVYRSDQAQLTIAAEAAPGGDPELNSGSRHTGGFNGLINNASGIAAGSTQITYDNGSNTLYKGDFIRIGNVNAGSSESSSDADGSTVNEYEIRRVVHFTGTTAGTIFLDRPTAFFHANNEIVINVEGSSSTEEFSYITTVPGIYEGVTLPEFTPTIEPRYLLGTSADRNFTIAYSGSQSFNGALSSFVVVDASPLRFPIGKMTTVPSSVASDSIKLDGAVKKGDLFIDCDGSDVGNLAVNDYIQIVNADGTTTTSEVRQIVDEPGTDIFRLDKPLRFDHADNSDIHEVSGGASPSGTFTHTITETFDLDTLSWNVLFRDTAETVANDLQRRYVGGIVDSATLSASEGGMLMMSYDSVPFLDMIHNQANQSTLGNNLYADGGGSEDAGMPRYSMMNSIDTTDISFPTTEPYYFSQGSFTLFGQEFARVRSVSISMSNSVEPRYYISPRHGRHRGPSEFREGRRSYSMACTVALPDTIQSIDESGTADETVNSANEIFKQVLLEGNYGEGSGLKGFAITLTFTRGTNDTITITIPNDGTAATGLNEAGAFILSAPYNITGDPIIQADLDILFRNMKIEIVDTKPSYI